MRLVLLRQRFKMIRLLGRGMFGNTYLAEDRDNLYEPCVVKQLICQTEGIEFSQTVVEPFIQEAEQLRRLQKNPHIPSILAYFEENHIPYLVQEYIDGQDLQQVVESQGVFSESQVRSLLLELLPILQTIHDQGVIHRDLKPAHIVRQQGDGKLILVGFCVSKQVNLSPLQKITSAQEHISYTPPEVFAVNTHYPSSDLYSLGASCVHLLTGVAPHALPFAEGDHWVNHWHQHLPQPISPELQAILDKLLKMEVTQRYTSALEVLKEVRVKTKPQSPIAPAPAAQSILFPVVSNQPPPIQKSPQPALSSTSIEVVQVSPKGEIVDRQNHLIHPISENLGKGLTLKLVPIPGGRFLMGSPPNELHRQPTEDPQHMVAVPDFYLGQFPVTQAQWRAVATLPMIKRDINPQPSTFTGDDRPVEGVSWFDGVEFCSRLSQLTGKDYHLPSEAAWEYACRAGSKTPFAVGETLNTDIANYDGTTVYGMGLEGIYRQQTTVVGKLPPNRYGLYDMHGNVWEWCGDHWHGSYTHAPSDGSVWQDQYFFACVLRGGAWNTPVMNCRCAARIWEAASERSHHIGFRVACTLAKPLSR
jgi:formylglycine-generating enzyme required for sulfatase activity/predicted Ser/Thr protein kinase